MISSGGSRGESVSLSFIVSRGCLYAMAHGPVSLQSLLLSLHLPSDLDTPVSSKDSCDFMGLKQIIQGELDASRSLLITSEKSLLLC